MASTDSLELLRSMMTNDLVEEGRNLVEGIKQNNEKSLRLVNERLDNQKDD